MKRYPVLLLLILSLTFLTAVESDPSATVGYFKKSIASGGWEAFTVPFGYDNLDPNVVMGSQYGDLDQLIDMTSPFGENAIYISGDPGMWVGDLASIGLTYGHAYWLNRDWANPTMDYYLMGTVDPHALTLHVSGLDEGGWSAFGLNEARDIDINSLAITGALDFDMIIDISSPFGENAIYISGDPGMWVGDLQYIVPTHAYWYNSSSPTSFNWSFTPPARGASGEVPAMPSRATRSSK